MGRMLGLAVKALMIRLCHWVRFVFMEHTAILGSLCPLAEPRIHILRPLHDYSIICSLSSFYKSVPLGRDFGRMDTCMYKANLYCPPETVPTLLIGYTHK